jgi:hypothetical protein
MDRSSGRSSNQTPVPDRRFGAGGDQQVVLGCRRIAGGSIEVTIAIQFCI